VNGDVCWGESNVQSITNSGKSGRPEYGRHNAANDADGSWIQPALCLQAPSNSRDAHSLKSREALAALEK
jgi:hypothetical protein